MRHCNGDPCTVYVLRGEKSNRGIGLFFDPADMVTGTLFSLISLLFSGLLGLDQCFAVVGLAWYSVYSRVDLRCAGYVLFSFCYLRCSISVFALCRMNEIFVKL